MNLATWFKGLGVFALSSMITVLATMQLDPASFNFSKAGLTKVGAAALVIGVKSVLLYLKQSPLPGNQPVRITDWTKITSVLALCLAIPACALLAGCVSSWDQTTYEPLAASKALIDCAVAGYNHFDADIRHVCADSQDGTQDAAFDPRVFYLPQTREAQQAVEKARQAQIAAVDAFAAYAVAKVAKDKAATVQEKQVAVIGLLEEFPALLNAVRGLMGKKPVSELKLPVVRDPVAAIAALKPAILRLESPDTN
ncbi:MAG: hypothetical protein LAO76_07250 [Acidobacteriia bacterium]|nr:hypothetical protein [Terriglobia bacterium]